MPSGAPMAGAPNAEAKAEHEKDSAIVKCNNNKNRSNHNSNSTNNNTRINNDNKKDINNDTGN